MKKLVCGILAFALLAIGVLGCAKKETVPARGVWDGHTYTNTEAGIRLTVPEGYHIDTDEEIIAWGNFADDYFNNVKSKEEYTDILISDDHSMMFINYKIMDENLAAEQYINLLKAQSKTQHYDGADWNIIYGDTVEKVLCGQGYTYYSFTLEGADDFYRGRCIRITSEGVLTYINIACKNEEQANAYLAFFDTASVS
ncbi:MAG TPA: hypothetical protein PK629_03220 [Oscillospiraceae bacterium]|nr:hypothetical protein [Oscillospiraceae bacterium]HPF55500.1 hypothetical protein [Clostridiales bacterium]HPK34778.1 hypothetical protein [Oscillospiraceae bacterium]HPR76122.1 hypothetical protein [Oscillospiraceae bacterium]